MYHVYSRLPSIVEGSQSVKGTIQVRCTNDLLLRTVIPWTIRPPVLAPQVQAGQAERRRSKGSRFTGEERDASLSLSMTCLGCANKSFVHRPSYCLL
jgi:hypothetical protein